MSKIDEFVELLESQVDKGIYVWGGDGENLSTMSDPIGWIKKRETSTQNAERACKLFEKRKAAGVDPILAFDCSGLMYWALKKVGVVKGDLSSRGQYGICNPIAKQELRKGDLVFRWTDKDNNGFDVSDIVHVGAMQSGTHTIECMGREVGVVYRKLSSRWNAFGRPKAFADIDEPTQPEDPSEYWRDLKVTDPLMRGADVLWVQTVLAEQEYSLGSLDGIYGSKTEQAVKDFQSDCDLPVTGVVDFGTWSALLTAMADEVEFWGDADGDGKITAADASKVLRSVVHLDGALTLKQGDANCDGNVTSADAAYILRCVVGLNKPIKIDEVEK